MSYALRNTIYLSVTLLLMVASGWAFIHFTQTGTLDELKKDIEEKQVGLETFEASAENYQSMLTSFLIGTYKVENHKKDLMPDNRVPPIYDYVRVINQGTANTEVNFTWSDSVSQSNYGINKFTVSGIGNYRNLFNFIQRLEQSKPLFKITSLQLQSIGELERLNDVSFEFQVDAYYRKEKKERYSSVMDINRTSMGITHNPFFPLIHNVPPNEDNLIDVAESRLIALSSRNAYLIDQQGSLHTLNVGDRVYLGHLQTIDDKMVTFVLNKGGITDRVTMEIETKINQ